MNTEITDIENEGLRGWVCYDARCPLCIRWAARVRPLLAGHGFVLVPLQSDFVRDVLNNAYGERSRPGCCSARPRAELCGVNTSQPLRGFPELRAAARARPTAPGAGALPALGEDSLLQEMLVITGDGLVLGGADAVLFLARRIPLGWPLAFIAQFPGIKTLLRRIYKWIARNRVCADGACEVHSEPAPKNTSQAWLPLILGTSVVAVFGRSWPAWVYMWALAFAMFVDCKWLTLQMAVRSGASGNLPRRLGYLFAWPGMDVRKFLSSDTDVAKVRRREWLFAIGKTLSGAALTWGGARFLFPAHPLLCGWTGMIGLVFVLHFGLFHLIALGWRMAGVNAQPLMRAPILSTALGEFWGNRWNAGFHQLASQFAFRPLYRRLGIRAAALAVFLLSGLIHELVISLPARGGFGLPTFYFLLQGAGVLIERTGPARRFGIGRGFRGWLFTLLITAGPAFLLFHPPFVLKVIIPFLSVIHAI